MIEALSEGFDWANGYVCTECGNDVVFTDHGEVCFMDESDNEQAMYRSEVRCSCWDKRDFIDTMIDGDKPYTVLRNIDLLMFFVMQPSWKKEA